MVKTVKEPNEKLMQDNPITISKLLKKPKDEIKWDEFNATKKQGKLKSNQFHGD